MKQRRPGLAKRAPRPAPVLQRELHALMAPKPIVVPPPSWWTRCVRSWGSRLLRFRQGVK